MDFDRATQRLQQDQSKLRGRRNVEMSVKAKREAEMRKKQQEQLAHERQRQQRRQAFLETYIRDCSREERSITSSGEDRFVATSIYGEGDKIALPSSVLEYLTNSGIETTPGSPWTFRIGILNPNYSYPASPLLQTMTVPEESVDDDENIMEGDSDDDTNTKRDAYLDELDHTYLSYTHGTVVEFTQEEGHVGLPESIASALINNATTTIPTTRTVDPAGTVDNMIVENDDDEKTPGHLAWGAFEIPNLPIEVRLVQLPKGKACTLLPTDEAIMNGFYNLKDIKLVLEQSLIRTRATLSLHDHVRTWYRGAKYDLSVTALKPSSHSAVLCINTDIEVEFESKRDTMAKQIKGQENSHVLGETSNDKEIADGNRNSHHPERNNAIPKSLSPEPPADQREGVCIVQIRAGETQGRRRFDVYRSSIRDLFSFAASVADDYSGNFRLVTRYPRKVYTLDQGSTSLADAGIMPGQELLILEHF